MTPDRDKTPLSERMPHSFLCSYHRGEQTCDCSVGTILALESQLAAKDERIKRLEAAARDFLEASPLAWAWPSYKVLRDLLTEHQETETGDRG